MKKSIIKVTTEQKIKLIETAIDSIIDVVHDIPESDAGYFVNQVNSVVSKLRDLQDKIEQSDLIDELTN